MTEVCGEVFREVLDCAVDKEEEITDSNWQASILEDCEHTEEQLKNMISATYSVLMSYTEYESNNLVLGSGRGSGLEA